MSGIIGGVQIGTNHDIPAVRVMGTDGKAITALVRPDITAIRVQCLQAAVDFYSTPRSVTATIKLAEEFVLWAIAPASADETKAAGGV